MAVILALALVVAVVVPAVVGEVYFDEDFNDGEGWLDRWVVSTHKGDDAGEFEITAGKWAWDEEDTGLQTGQDARFYQASAKMSEDFSSKGKDLVVQYVVKHEQGLDCGGGYVKILPAGLDQEDFNGDSDYNIMFGPDICGATKKVHVIFNYKGKNHLVKKEIPCKSDEVSHVYTLIVKSDNTFVVKIDGEERESGSLEEDFDMLPPKEIDDPDVSKPEDWVDVEEIEDETDEKPEDWDQPEQIQDPDAEIPEDWDEELDGDWEAPLIDNPDYKGEWKAKMMPNPDYKGPWEHPQIANPDYEADDSIYAYDSNAFVGFELWQVKSGTIFDKILVTDDIALADERAEAFKALQEAESQVRDDVKDTERQAAEEERKAAEEAADAEDEDEEDEEDDTAEEDAHEDL